MTRTPLIVALAGLFVAQGAWADSVSGQFTLGGNAVKPAEVAAFRVRDQFNPREFTTYVMLTATPVDKPTIAKDTDPYARAINDDAVRDADYLSFHVNAAGVVGMNAHVGGTQYIDSSGKIMGSKGALAATCTTKPSSGALSKVNAPPLPAIV